MANPFYLLFGMLGIIIFLLIIGTIYDDSDKQCASIGSHKTIFTGQQTLCVMPDGSLHVVPHKEDK